MFSTLSLNTLLTQVADHLLAGVVSVVGGVVSALAVAWVKAVVYISHVPAVPVR